MNLHAALVAEQQMHVRKIERAQIVADGEISRGECASAPWQSTGEPRRLVLKAKPRHSDERNVRSARNHFSGARSLRLLDQRTRESSGRGCFGTPRERRERR